VLPFPLESFKGETPVPKNTASDEDFMDECITNFEEGDKSLWTKLLEPCVHCGSTVWVCTADVETGQKETDQLGACEKCGTGNLDYMLGNF
jgi:hypothetical protein